MLQFVLPYNICANHLASLVFRPEPISAKGPPTLPSEFPIEQIGEASTFSMPTIARLNAEFAKHGHLLDFPHHDVVQNRLLWYVCIQQQQEQVYETPAPRPNLSAEQNREYQALLARDAPSYEAFMKRMALPVCTYNYLCIMHS